MDEITTKELLDIFERLAEQTNDGHLTIMRFSRCWKIMAGTPDLDCNEGRKQVGALKEFNTLKDALISGYFVRSFIYKTKYPEPDYKSEGRAHRMIEGEL